MPKTVAEAQQLIGEAETAGADFVEIRLDTFTDLGYLAEFATHGKAPKIATLKLASRDGKFTGTETHQKEILLKAATSGFDYVDIDLETTDLKEFANEMRESGAKIIVSVHNFKTTPEIAELNQILDEEIAYGADVCKIVTTANRVEDNLSLLGFTAVASKMAKVVCFGMKEAGRISRVLSPLFGGFFTFASLGRGAETAPGQMSIDEMQAIYKLLGL
jgi:3-dehydroquinate dehydratase type I